jgi:hypothetical protein
MQPLKLQGATGSTVAPTAIRLNTDRAAACISGALSHRRTGALQLLVEQAIE